MEVQLIKPGEGRKYKIGGRSYEPGTNWFRVEGEPGDARVVYEVRYRWQTTRLVITRESVTIIGGGFGKRQAYEAGTLFYDAYVAQLKALEDKIYSNSRTWRGRARAWAAWVKRGKPELKRSRVRGMDLYLKYSPTTRQV